MRGGSGVPLIYIMRSINKLHLKTLVDDPVTDYATHDEEIFKREPIIAIGNPLGMKKNDLFNGSFIADREIIWDLISPIIIETEAWPLIKRARTSRDGRKVMLAFHDHFPGPNKVNQIQKQAEQKLLSLSYIREKERTGPLNDL